MGNPQIESVIEDRMERWTNALKKVEATPQILIAQKADGNAEMIINPNLEWDDVLVVLKDAIKAIEEQA